MKGHVQRGRLTTINISLDFLPQDLQVGVEGGEGEAHDVVVAAFDARYAHHTYPFLDAVGAGLVEGTVGVDIMADFVVGHLAEVDIGLL